MPQLHPPWMAPSDFVEAELLTSSELHSAVVRTGVASSGSDSLASDKNKITGNFAQIVVCRPYHHHHLRRHHEVTFSKKII